MNKKTKKKTAMAELKKTQKIEGIKVKKRGCI